MNKLFTYLKNVRGELAFVNWPSRTQAIAHTALIVLISGLVAVLLAGLDYAFSGAVNRFLIGA